MMSCFADGREQLRSEYGNNWFIPHRWASWSDSKLQTVVDVCEARICDAARREMRLLYCQDYPSLFLVCEAWCVVVYRNRSACIDVLVVFVVVSLSERPRSPLSIMSNTSIEKLR